MVTEVIFKFKQEKTIQLVKVHTKPLCSGTNVVYTDYRIAEVEWHWRASKNTAEDLDLPAPEANGKNCLELSQASAQICEQGWRTLWISHKTDNPYHFRNSNLAWKKLSNCRSLFSACLFKEPSVDVLVLKILLVSGVMADVFWFAHWVANRFNYCWKLCCIAEVTWLRLV